MWEQMEDILAERGLIFRGWGLACNFAICVSKLSGAWLAIVRFASANCKIACLNSLICCIFFCSSVEASLPSKEVKAAVAPYLMPNEHPIKSSLDALFSSSRVILNLDTLVEAGFKKTTPRKFTKLIVTKHADFPGYIFKLYLDAQRPHKKKPEHHYWILRICGAKKIKHEIKERGLEAFFKVPKKWIYALPKQPTVPSGYHTKYYILVEEDMDVLPDEENEALWASDAISPQLLQSLYDILKAVGLSDCAKPDNIPISRDGRVAFIDTQSYDMRVYFGNLSIYLSKPNQRHWKSILKKR